ncbi:MAG: TonB-dependent receptor [Acidobacteriia bacterium]|nr:TonB-dependent receptor [Terriglobia bacterium]
MKKTLRLLCFAVLFALIRQLAFAQGSATGDLHVTVKDPKGGMVTNATVTVRDVAKGLERTGAGDGQGGYSANLLPPGTYSVTVDAPGFAKAEATGVSITVGQSAELPVALTLATGREVIEVSSQAELIETSRSSTTNTIGERRMDNLPINGRNYIQFTLTDSQVQRDSAPNVGAAPTSGLNMSGQRGRSNLVNVDGADATDNSTNGVRSTVSQEAVQEFQIISNSYAAEYGRASGGVVNIITRSGSNEFHGDVFGYLRNRNFQAVNPFSTVSNPAYTRVQAGAAFGGALKKDKTFYYFSVETTRRHETGFSSIQPATNPGFYGLQNFDTSQTAGGAVPLPFGTILVTPQQAAFLQGLTPAAVGAIGLLNIENYTVLAGASSGMALQGAWPGQMVTVLTDGLLNTWSGFPTTTPPGSTYSSVPTSFQSLGSQAGNFPVFEGTTLYSLRLDHNLTNNHRLTLRVNVSPSTVTGIEGSGQDQPFGQNAYSRTSEQSYRDVSGLVQETWAMGTNKVNEFRFQYARRGLSYFYNKGIQAGSYPAVNIPGFGYFGREPYSYIQRTEKRYQVTDNFSWAVGRHSMKFGGDFNYLPVDAIFTVNYGGVYDFGTFAAFPQPFPELNPVQAYGAGLPGDYIQGLGSPSDSFRNIPIGVFWQDSWRVNPNLTVNYGVRYDVEKPPSFKPPQGLALPAYDLLGLQKGIQTDKNNFQPRVGIAWDPKGDGKTVVRASFGMFYDHPLLGLYFLGDASDGSSSGQLAFGPGAPCNAGTTPYDPGNLNAASIFTGVLGSANCMPISQLAYSANQQAFSCPASDTSCGVASPSQSLFLSQNYLNNPPAQFGGAAFPLAFQPFGYPQAKNFVFAYSQQANLTVERDLGRGFALSLAYNFNGGRHLNHPINANTTRGDLVVANFQAAASDPTSYAAIGGPLGVGAGPSSQGYAPCGVNPSGQPWVSAALTNFFRPGGINPAIANILLAEGAGACVTTILPAVMHYFQASGYSTAGFNTACDPVAPFTGCVPFGDMDANYSNGSSVYHGLSANLRKRFSDHYEFLASYTWSHAIDDSTDLQSTLSPQDSYFPGLDRSNSTFDQRHRFVFSGVYQTGKLAGSGFASKLFSDWTFAPLVEISSGRPFNIITGNADNFQFESKTGRPNTTVNPACGAGVPSKYSPTGFLQEPCLADFNGTLLSLDGTLGRNAGLTPWTAFGDLRVAKKIHFGERFSMDLIVDMFNIANKYNVAAVSPFFQNAGQATGAYDPRQFQFALKLNW